MPNDSLVQPLFDGALDIVGDVHGEIEALCQLIQHLGYRDDGSHADGRHLVFLGDLIDRGPDSPAVADLVQRLITTGMAQCVLGNHDLNVLLWHKKFDNDWFFGRPFEQNGQVILQKLADDRTRDNVVAFFKTLPLVLERPGVRVVHACWKPEMVDVARMARDVKDLYDSYHDLIEADNCRRPTLSEVERDLQHQNRNPVKVLTSGLEHPINPPKPISGKLRHLDRVPWWDTYTDREHCVFGHYSTSPDKVSLAAPVTCVDFGVGHRWKERIAPGFDGRFSVKLAALRLPELEIICDDGTKKLS